MNKNYTTRNEKQKTNTYSKMWVILEELILKTNLYDIWKNLEERELRKIALEFYFKYKEKRFGRGKKIISKNTWVDYVFWIFKEQLNFFEIQETKDKGYGLFWKDNSQFKIPFITLFGELECNIRKTEIKLEDPSLFKLNEMLIPLYGPLSLVNHSCSSNLSFYMVNKEDYKLLNPYHKVYNNNKLINDKTMVILNSSYEEFRKGDELLVDYGYKFNNCKCSSCMGDEKKKKTRTREIIPKKIFDNSHFK